MFYKKFIILVLCSVNGFCQLFLGEYEDDPEKACSWQGLNGNCVNIFKCRSAQDYINKNITLHVCSDKDEEPIICCPDCQPVEDTRNIIYDPTIGVLIKTGPKAEEKCFEYLRTLDYPCKKAFKSQYPMKIDEKNNCNEYLWELESTKNETLLSNYEDYVLKHSPHWAYLGYGEDTRTADWLCGGSVISNRFILTAADCVHPDAATGSVKFIALDIYKRWVSPSTWQHYNVKRAIPHPEFKPPSKYHDIALLETDREITFGSNVLPACLFTPSTTRRIENELLMEPAIRTVVWSEGENGTLEIVEVHRGYDEGCSKFYPPQRLLEDGYNMTSQACFYTSKKTTSSCDGELGSPVEQTLAGCVKLIAGVVSFKRTCGDEDFGLLTMVHDYVPWIESFVWP